MDTTIQEIQNLIAQKKFAEASALIKASATKPMTDKEKAEALGGLSMTYMKLTNAVNAGYRDALKEAVEGLKKIRGVETQVKEKINLAEVREKLNN